MINYKPKTICQKVGVATVTALLLMSAKSYACFSPTQKDITALQQGLSALSKASSALVKTPTDHAGSGEHCITYQKLLDTAILSPTQENVTAFQGAELLFPECAPILPSTANDSQGEDVLTHAILSVPMPAGDIAPSQQSTVAVKPADDRQKMISPPSLQQQINTLADNNKLLRDELSVLVLNQPSVKKYLPADQVAQNQQALSRLFQHYQHQPSSDDDASAPIDLTTILGSKLGEYVINLQLESIMDFASSASYAYRDFLSVPSLGEHCHVYLQALISASDMMSGYESLNKLAQAELNYPKCDAAFFNAQTTYPACAKKLQKEVMDD